MPTRTGELHVNKHLLVWPTRIPNEIRALFTMVFMDIFGMINYVYKVLPKTDTFHIVIPLNCLGDLLKDPLYKFSQVIHIDVICPSISDMRRFQRCFQSGLTKVKFSAIDNLLELWEKAKVVTSSAFSALFDRIVKNAIISLIQARIAAKQSDISIHRSQIRRQLASTSLYGFPVMNTPAFAPSFICASCDLVYQQAYQLECGHQQCQICVNIRNNCATCSQVVFRDNLCKISLDQNLSIHCLNCNWIQPLKDYELHLIENHDELITRFICNRQDNASIPVVSLNGTCIWEISDIENITNDAASNGQKSIYSDPFYVFPNGYKMCMRLYINGDYKARNTHMSLFFAIMRGEYDAVLQWPFQFKVTFSLIDQSITNGSQEHMSKFCWPDTIAMCFERPDTDMNVAFGIPMFVSLASFKKNQNRYVRNNTMYIKIQIDPFAEKPTLPLMEGAGELPNDEEHVHTTDDDISASICPFGQVQ